MEERIAELSEEVVAHPALQTYIVMGQLQQSMGRLDDAQKSFQQALKLDPKSEDARSGLASITR
jgi:cytochrome c-type biogenesis protein CcmH/NrfG